MSVYGICREFEMLMSMYAHRCMEKPELLQENKKITTVTSAYVAIWSYTGKSNKQMQ